MLNQSRLASFYAFNEPDVILRANQGVEKVSDSRHQKKAVYEQTPPFSGWTVGSKPVGQNDVFTIRPKYYDKAKTKTSMPKPR